MDITFPELKCHMKENNIKVLLSSGLMPLQGFKCTDGEVLPSTHANARARICPLYASAYYEGSTYLFERLLKLVTFHNKEDLQQSLNECLCIAASAHNLSVTVLCLKEGANPNCCSNHGCTFSPLEETCYCKGKSEAGCLAVIEVLCDAGASDLSLALYWIIGKNMPTFTVMKYLLLAGADPNYMYERDGRGKMSILANLVNQRKYSDNHTLARLLLQHGADVNFADPYFNRTALIFATNNNAVKTVKALLDEGANPDIMSTIMINFASKTALHIACMKGYKEVFVLLIQALVNVNIKAEIQLSPAMWTKLDNIAQYIGTSSANFTPLECLTLFVNHHKCAYDMANLVTEAGARVRPSWLTIPVDYYPNKGLYQMVKQKHSQPPTLMQSCRIYFRQLAKMNCMTCVSDLPDLPWHLKPYLTLTHETADLSI